MQAVPAGVHSQTAAIIDRHIRNANSAAEMLKQIREIDSALERLESLKDVSLSVWSSNDSTWRPPISQDKLRSFVVSTLKDERQSIIDTLNRQFGK